MTHGPHPPGPAAPGVPPRAGPTIDLAQVCAARPDLAQLVVQGPAALVAYVLALEEALAAARCQRVPFGDSRTTHAPPSSDPRPKPRSERRKSQRRAGGRAGNRATPGTAWNRSRSPTKSNATSWRAAAVAALT